MVYGLTMLFDVGFSCFDLTGSVIPSTARLMALCAAHVSITDIEVNSTKNMLQNDPNVVRR